MPGYPRKYNSAVSVGLAGLARIARWNTGDFVKIPSVRPLSISISTSVCACAGETQNKATARNVFLICPAVPKLLPNRVKHLGAPYGIPNTSDYQQGKRQDKARLR